MKGLILILSLVALSITSVSAQESVLVIENKDISDSAVVNLGPGNEVYKWSEFLVEVLFEKIAEEDTLTEVEIYNTINNDFTGAVNIANGTRLRASDGAGGTGTIIKTDTIGSNYFDNLRFVVDPDPDATDTSKVTVRIKPLYKTNYNPPGN